MTKYSQGAAFERTVRRDLEEKGAVHVIRSAGSKGMVDLAAFYPDKVLFVQVKRTGKITKRAKDALADLARSVKAIPVIASSLPGNAVEYDYNF